MGKKPIGGWIASYVTVQVEYFVAVVDSDGPATDKPHLEPSDKEDEIGYPQREKQKELQEMVSNDVIPKPAFCQLRRLYGK